MPTYLLTSPDGKKYRVTGEGTGEQALAQLQSRLGSPQPKQSGIGEQRYAAEDAATEKANQEKSWYEKLGTGIKAQTGRVVLGGAEFANNLTGDKLFDPEVLALAQQGADTMDRGTGAWGTVGNLAGDARNWIGVGAAGKGIQGANTLRQAAMASGKAGAAAGALTGLTEGTGEADSTVLTNLKNAAIGGGIGGTLGVAIPYAGAGLKSAGKAVGRGGQRIASGMGNKSASDAVAYRNIAKILKNEGYQPGEVASIIDEFKSQGIKGGTLGQILESPELLAREKNLLQGGGKAGKMMSDKLKSQPREIADSVVERVQKQYQPEQTDYLYKEAAKFADEVGVAEKMGAVKQRATSGSQRHLVPAVKSLERDLRSRAGELPSTARNKISRIITDMKNGTIGADKGKQMLDDMYKASSNTTEQDTINEIVLGMRQKLNTALEEAGGPAYVAGKNMAKRDMAMMDAMEAFDTSNVGSLKTAFNKFFGSPEKQREFLDKLPDGATRKEFESFLTNLEKVTGKFGGSDTASNLANRTMMGNEFGFGFDPTIMNMRTWQDRLAAPISKNVRSSQVGATFNPDADKLAGVMREMGNKARPSYLKTAVGAGLAAGNATESPSTPEPAYQPSAPVELNRPQSSLFQRVIKQESGGKQFDKSGKPLTSPAGAIGIAQVMPKTAPEAAKLAGVPFNPSLYRTSAEYNAKLGEAYLNKQLEDFGGNELHALAAYNWGPGATRKWIRRGGDLNKLPTETRNYITKILGV